MAKMPVRQKKNEEADESGGWLITYGDLMTQLLIFFVMLFSLSTISEVKLTAVAESVSEAFGYHPTTLEEDLEEPNVIQIYAAKLRAGALSHGISGEHLKVEAIDRGIKISLGGKFLFKKHSAEIRTEAYKKLSEVADFIRGYDKRIEVIGHCGSEPLPTDSIFKDKWELSWRRAYNVSLYLQKARIRGNRFRVAGSAQFEPAEKSLFEESEDRNRRVELIVTEDEIHRKTDTDMQED